ncbi:MAG: cobyrinate a,c-diamide synthase, partial [candidate division NC10 bacterium]|nr:cobyrinate a,c-diamide synthase [candidate division NC10 bacterium]
MRGMLIAGTGSGVGKTTFSLGLMALFKRRGFSVQAFKVGPDFIDPGLHALVTGRPSYNLDGWLLSRDSVVNSFFRHNLGAEYAIAEGVMGLFDGLRGGGEEGSSAQIAKWLALPVILVVDVGGMARSAAALVKGFETFDPGLKISGIVFNRVGGEGHFRSLKEAVEGSCQGKVLGYLPWDERLHLPERHLGLITAQEDPFSPGYLDRLADLIEAHGDVERLFQGATDQNLVVYHSDFEENATSTRSLPLQGGGVEGGVRIGIAYDKAFCFYYP